MHVFVTGATGFVGSAVVRALLRHGHSVTGLVRDRARGVALEAQGVSLAVGDMRSPESCLPLVQQVDAVIHAAQEKIAGRWTRPKIDAMHESDKRMTLALAEACLAHDRLLIYTSGALSHIAAPGEWIDETSPLRPCLLAKGHADVVAELARQHESRGLRMQVVTPGFVYGRGSFLKETIDLLRARKYRIIGRGDNDWSLVHVDDLAEVYALALERGRPGDNYFVGDDAPLPRRDVIHQVCDGLGLPRVGHVPGWIAGLMLGFPLVEALSSPIRIRNTFVKQRLGWTPRYPTFAEGLPHVLAAFR